MLKIHMSRQRKSFRVLSSLDDTMGLPVVTDKFQGASVYADDAMLAAERELGRSEIVLYVYEAYISSMDADVVPSTLVEETKPGAQARTEESLENMPNKAFALTGSLSISTTPGRGASPVFIGVDDIPEYHNGLG